MAIPLDKLSHGVDIKDGEHKNFADDDKFTYDMVMVFKVGEENKKLKVMEKGEAGSKKTMKQITEKEHFASTTADCLKRLQAAGLKTDLWYSIQKDEIYCRLGGTEKRLQREADRFDYDLQLDHMKCLNKGKELGVKLAAATENHVIKEDAWLNVFGKYDQYNEHFPWRQDLYKRYYTGPEWQNHPRYNSLFNSIDRIKITTVIVEADAKLGGAEMPVSKMIKNKTHSLCAFFSLHEPAKRAFLKAKMANWRAAFKAPLQDIRDYFGEAIAFYFAFLGYYNRCLLAPAIIGFCFFIYQIGEGRVDVRGIPAWAVFISLWATLFLEFWKRREAKYRVRWGMSKFFEKEQPRPEFKGQWTPSPIDGHLVEHFPLASKIRRLLLSSSVIFSLMSGVIGIVVGIFVLRSVMEPSLGSAVIYIAAIINAIQIQVLNVIYGFVSNFLTEYENHKTDTEHENALIAKTFLFRFVNCYNALFYVAFFKRFDRAVKYCKEQWDDPNDPTLAPFEKIQLQNCLPELRIQLGTIFISMIVVNNFIELFVPFLKGKLAQRANSLKPEDAASTTAKKSEPEEEFELEPYESTIPDFDELVVQFGYVCLFVVAFPLTPLLALLSNIVEVYIDSNKLCKFTRRPEPRGAANIGTWFDILTAVSFIAVFTNCAIVCFETVLFHEFFADPADRAYTFILAEHAILGFKFAIAYFVPDEPQDVVIHLARQEYIVNVLLKGMEDVPDLVVPTDGDDDEVSAASGGDNFDWSVVSDTIRLNTGHES